MLGVSRSATESHSSNELLQLDEAHNMNRTFMHRDAQDSGGGGGGSEGRV